MTIASLLRGQGYATRMVGKWHVGDQREFLPPAHGFDDFLGLPYSNDMHCDLELPPSIGRMPPLMLLRQDRVIEADPNQVSLTDRYLVDALRFIHDNRDRPFFLYFAHHYVHSPIYVPQNYLLRSVVVGEAPRRSRCPVGFGGVEQLLRVQARAAADHQRDVA